MYVYVVHAISITSGLLSVMEIRLYVASLIIIKRERHTLFNHQIISLMRVLNTLRCHFSYLRGRFQLLWTTWVCLTFALRISKKKVHSPKLEHAIQKKKQPTNKIKDKQTRIDPQILFIEDVVHDLTKFDWYFLFLRTQIKTTCLRAVKIK